MGTVQESTTSGAGVGAAREQIEQLLEQAPDGYLVLGERAEVVWASTAGAALFDLDAEALIGRTFGWPAQVGREVDIELIGGPRRVASLRAAEVSWCGRDAVLVALRNVTAERALESELQRSEAILRAAFEYAPAGLAVCEAGGTVLDVNDTLARLSGYEPGELRGASFALLLDEDGGALEKRRRRQLLDGRLEGVVFEAMLRGNREVRGRVEVRIRRADVAGDESSLVYQVMETAGQLPGRPDAAGDAPCDRATFLRELDRRIEECRRYGLEAALLMVDIDRLGEINETLGHETGDRVLRLVSDSLQGRVRASDLFAELEGDEFGVLMPRVIPGDVESLALSLLESARGCAVTSDGAPAPVSARVSIGATLIGPAARSPDEVLQNASGACQDAKAAGGDRYVLRRRR